MIFSMPYKMLALLMVFSFMVCCEKKVTHEIDEKATFHVETSESHIVQSEDVSQVDEVDE